MKLIVISGCATQAKNCQPFFVTMYILGENMLMGGGGVQPPELNTFFIKDKKGRKKPKLWTTKV